MRLIHTLLIMPVDVNYYSSIYTHKTKVINQKLSCSIHDGIDKNEK